MPVLKNSVAILLTTNENKLRTNRLYKRNDY
jgi:hypothetical protein